MRFNTDVFNSGFDAVLGTLDKIDIRNAKNEKLGDVLNKHLETNLGVTVEGFPNVFMIFGPQSAYANAPMVIDMSADWVGRTLGWMKENNKDRCESTHEGAVKWSEHVRAVYNMLVIAKSSGDKNIRSWMVGSNIADREVTPIFYFGGVPAYSAAMKKEIDEGFPGHSFATVNSSVKVA